MKAFVIIALFVMTMMCHADVVYKGRADHVRRWNTLYHGLSPAWRDKVNLEEIEYSDSSFDNYMAYHYGHDDTFTHVVGIYRESATEKPNIHIRGSYRKIDHVMLHEYAHYLWFHILTEQDRSTYMVLWLTQDPHISDYAGSSIAEGFAEDWATYILTPSLFSTFETPVYNFFHDQEFRRLLPQ